MHSVLHIRPFELVIVAVWVDGWTVHVDMLVTFSFHDTASITLP